MCLENFVSIISVWVRSAQVIIFLAIKITGESEGEIIFSRRKDSLVSE